LDHAQSELDAGMLERRSGSLEREALACELGQQRVAEIRMSQSLAPDQPADADRRTLA
jgi:hypothetical protein